MRFVLRLSSRMHAHARTLHTITASACTVGLACASCGLVCVYLFCLRCSMVYVKAYALACAWLRFVRLCVFALMDAVRPCITRGDAHDALFVARSHCISGASSQSHVCSPWCMSTACLPVLRSPQYNAIMFDKNGYLPCGVLLSGHPDGFAPPGLRGCR